MLSSGLFLILFSLLLLLALESVPSGQIGTQTTGAGYLVVVIGGLILGARAVYRSYRSERVQEYAQKFSIQIPVMIAFVVLYYLLARYRPAYAVWFGICYVVARVLTHLGIYISARV